MRSKTLHRISDHVEKSTVYSHLTPSPTYSTIITNLTLTIARLYLNCAQRSKNFPGMVLEKDGNDSEAENYRYTCIYTYQLLPTILQTVGSCLNNSYKVLTCYEDNCQSNVIIWFPIVTTSLSVLSESDVYVKKHFFLLRYSTIHYCVEYLLLHSNKGR